MCQSSRSVGTIFLQNSEESNEESNQITKRAKDRFFGEKINRPEKITYEKEASYIFE